MNQDEVERYRKMTPAERLALAMELTNNELRQVFSRPTIEIQEFFARIRQENDDSNRALLEGLARADRLRSTDQ